MGIFDFLRRFFDWADSAARKRRAPSSFTSDISNDSDTCANVKRRKSCNNCSHVEVDLIEIDDSSEDEIQILNQSPQRSHPRAKMGCSSNNKRTETMLNKTHRLREKTQYKELLQKFVPQRAQPQPRLIRREAVEVIDLDEYEQKSPARTSPPPLPRSRSFKHLVINLNDDPDRRNVESFSKSSKNTPSKQCSSESVRVNSLRDQLSAKAVLQQDFIPRLAKRYNERVEQRHKEAAELEKMTTVLSKHNRLVREAALEKHLARSMRLSEAVLDETEEPEIELPELTETMLRQIQQALIPQPGDQVLVEGFGLRITRKDMHTLAQSNWLNDEVINFYMNLLIARGGKNDFPRVHAMNTFFYPKLLSGGHSSLKRWTRKVDVFAQDLIVVPIHLGIHWCMAIIDFRAKSIRYYDSMGGCNNKCLTSLRCYLEAESLDKKKEVFDTRKWRLINEKDIPQQMNGSDCGVFSCMFAEFICANRKITFTQDDMGYFRKKMVYEILTSKIL